MVSHHDYLQLVTILYGISRISNYYYLSYVTRCMCFGFVGRLYVCNHINNSSTVIYLNTILRGSSPIFEKF